MRLFVTDYASYNDGSQFEFGKWWNLEDFADASDFLEAVSEYFEECDENRPLPGGTPREELMFTDFEGFPRDLYGESMSEEEIQKIYDYNYIEWPETDEDWVSLHNEYCSDLNYSDDEIYHNDEEFLNTFFSGRINEAVRAVFYGDFRYMDKYVKFDGYGNLETTNYPMDWIDEDAIREWKLQNV